MTEIRALVLATILRVKDGHFIFPYCNVCYCKVNEDADQTRYTCYKCQKLFDESQLCYRYRLSATISDGHAACDVSIFGKCLEMIFGLEPAALNRQLRMRIDPKQPEEIVNEMFLNMVSDLIVGKVFYFGFKLPHKMNTTPHPTNCTLKYVLSQLKPVGSDASTEGIVAYQILSSTLTPLRPSLFDVLQQQFGQRNEALPGTVTKKHQHELPIQTEASKVVAKSGNTSSNESRLMLNIDSLQKDSTVSTFEKSEYDISAMNTDCDFESNLFILEITELELTCEIGEKADSLTPSVVINDNILADISPQRYTFSHLVSKSGNVKKPYHYLHKPYQKCKKLVESRSSCGNTVVGVTAHVTSNSDVVIGQSVSISDGLNVTPEPVVLKPSNECNSHDNKLVKSVNSISSHQCQCKKDVDILNQCRKSYNSNNSKLTPTLTRPLPTTTIKVVNGDNTCLSDKCKIINQLDPKEEALISNNYSLSSTKLVTNCFESKAQSPLCLIHNTDSVCCSLSQPFNPQQSFRHLSKTCNTKQSGGHHLCSTLHSSDTKSSRRHSRCSSLLLPVTLQASGYSRHSTLHSSETKQSHGHLPCYISHSKESHGHHPYSNVANVNNSAKETTPYSLINNPSFAVSTLRNVYSCPSIRKRTSVVDDEPRITAQLLVDTPSDDNCNFFRQSTNAQHPSIEATVIPKHKHVTCIGTCRKHSNICSKISKLECKHAKPTTDAELHSKHSNIDDTSQSINLLQMLDTCDASPVQITAALCNSVSLDTSGYNCSGSQELFSHSYFEFEDKRFEENGDSYPQSQITPLDVSSHNKLNIKEDAFRQNHSTPLRAIDTNKSRSMMTGNAHKSYKRQSSLLKSVLACSTPLLFSQTPLLFSQDSFSAISPMRKCSKDNKHSFPRVKLCSNKSSKRHRLKDKTAEVHQSQHKSPHVPTTFSGSEQSWNGGCSNILYQEAGSNSPTQITTSTPDLFLNEEASLDCPGIVKHCLSANTMSCSQSWNGSSELFSPSRCNFECSYKLKPVNAVKVELRKKLF